MARYSSVKYTLLLCIMLTSIKVTSTSCSDGYYYDENGKCMSCPSHCLFCDSINKCLSCENGYWGAVCELKCSKCKTGTGCEKTNGFCFDSCRDGLSGILCDAKCNKKCSSCNRTNINLCLNCVSGRYPAGSCDLVCSNCNNTACDENGDCISGCVNGYWNKTCMSDCPEDCINKSCQFGNGSCTYGSNRKHDEPRSDKEKETNSMVIVVIGVTLTVVVLGGVVGIFIIFRRKRHTRKGSNGAPQHSSQETKDEETSAHLLKGPDTDLSNNQLQVPVTPIHKSGREKLLEFIQRLQTMTDKGYKDEFKQLCNTCKSKRETDFVKEFEKQNLLPIDQNHFTVEMDNGKIFTMNASFIKTRKSDLPVYVACKGPIDDISGGFHCFWTMLWKLDCTTVVMLNTLDDIGKNDLKQYWPTLREPSSFGQIFVEYKTNKKEEKKKYISRTFIVKKGEETKTVTQLQYQDWPEKGCAASGQNLLNFLKLVHETHKQDRGPLVVHGRAGTGRTGTFIALDMLVQEAEDMVGMVDCTEETKLDVINCVKHLRAQRKNMLENVEQYRFLHEALSWYITEILNVKLPNEEGNVLERAGSWSKMDKHEQKSAIDSAV